MDRIHASTIVLLITALLGCVDKAPLGEHEGDGTGSASAGDDTSGGSLDGSTSDSGGTGGTGENPDACELVPDPGDCNAAFVRYFFDPGTRECTPFLYGGCDGVVPFETMADCEASCQGCEHFEDPVVPDLLVDVVLENHGDAPVYVDPHVGGEPGCDPAYPFALSDPAWPNVGDFELELGCRYTCSHAARFCDLPGCPGICVHNPPIRIDPGGRYTVPWAAVTYRETRLPSSCAECDDEPEPVLECMMLESLRQGYQYQFRALAGSAPECFGGDCDCEPDAEGSCAVESSDGVLDPSIEASALVSWGPGTAVTLVFE